MKLIQALLLVLISAGLFYYLRRLRSKLRDRMIVVGLALAGATFVLFPETTTALADWAGVGRGVDLIFYLSFVMLAFVQLLVYSKLRHMEAKITDLARAAALQQASHEETRVRPKLVIHRAAS